MTKRIGYLGDVNFKPPFAPINIQQSGGFQNNKTMNVLGKYATTGRIRKPMTFSFGLNVVANMGFWLGFDDGIKVLLGLDLVSKYAPESDGKAASTVGGLNLVGYTAGNTEIRDAIKLLYEYGGLKRVKDETKMKVYLFQFGKAIFCPVNIESISFNITETDRYGQWLAVSISVNLSEYMFDAFFDVDSDEYFKGEGGGFGKALDAFKESVDFVPEYPIGKQTLFDSELDLSIASSSGLLSYAQRAARILVGNALIEGI